MAKRGSFNLFETHVEKVVLAGCGIFALAMLWMYILNNPNQREYNGKNVGPRELDQAILANARDLQSAMRRAKTEHSDMPAYDQQLRKSHAAGILTAGGKQQPGLAATLRLASSFGKPIVVPGLEGEEEAADIVLVTPLRPQVPRLLTGRSVALREAMILPGMEPAAAPPPLGGKTEEMEEGTEFAWVSAAAYFDSKAQRNEMANARYASYRTKVYVAGVEAQRQEMTADGEFSDWRNVEQGNAAVHLDVEDPVFDDVTNVMVNKEKLETLFRLVKQYQQDIMQPQFYTVDVGDVWDMPPLEGFGDDDELLDDSDDEALKERARQRREERKERRKNRNQSRGGTPRGPAGGHGGGGGAIGMEGGGGGSRDFGGGGVSAGRSNTREKAEAGKWIRAAFKEAKIALRKDKDYRRAIQIANEILSNEYVKRGDEKRADGIIFESERRLEKLRRTGGMEGDGQPMAFVVHPEKPGLKAAWIHDDSVEAGKTYRYRMRLNLWNRYVGQPRPLRNPQESRHSLLIGDWSLPSEPISVTPSTYFFVIGATPDRSGANVEVYKWRQGVWLKQKFPVQIGEVIGGVKRVKLDEYDDDGKQMYEDVDFSTGAVVLDLRMNQPFERRMAAGTKGEHSYRTQATLTLSYLEPADGQVKQRFQLTDSTSPLRGKLQDGG